VPAIVEFQGVSKSYPVYTRPSDRLKELSLLNRRKFHDDFWALRDVTFSIEKGETFCLIGENGSGKSTTLQIIAGILQPSSGTVSVSGRVAALLELGSGFNPEYTGRDNVYLNASILGLSARDIDARYHDIEEFAEIGDFINQPVKTYSSGMAVRLAFSVAIHVDPEILLVDEALAVGDIYFRQRCMRKVHELRARGVTIIFVSHSMGDVKAIGDRCLWLEHGHVRQLGPADEVVLRYVAEMNQRDSAYLEHAPLEIAPSKLADPSTPEELVRTLPNIDHRHGNGQAEVLGISIYNHHGEPVHLLEPNTRITVRISIRAIEDLPLPVVGFMIRNHLGVDFSGTNTAREGRQLPHLRPGEACTVDFQIELPHLYPGHFSFSPAVANGTLHSYAMCDWVDNALTLQMAHGSGQVYGFIHLPCKVEVNSRLRPHSALTESNS
jgi:lipopolysaccharide transport system ATP-binding protein